MKTAFLQIALICSVPVMAQDYSDGVFVLNEDWYGHNNSSLNFLHPESGDIDYYIVQTNPSNMADDGTVRTLGCTAQYAEIYGGKIYVVSKQDQDPGEDASKKTGGRFVVLDASTMEVLHSSRYIASKGGKSVADGRSFLGVSADKGYIGTSNGIYMVNLSDYTITGPIDGTENPLVTGDESAADGLGALYENQTGMMLRLQDYVLAIKQDCGILVIDPDEDKVEKVIPGCFSTMTRSLDGYVWAGMNTNEDYMHYPYGSAGEQWTGTSLLRIDPYTLETVRKDLPVGGVNQTWYAWNAGSLCASARRNVLYFVYNEDFSQGQGAWFTTSHLYRYDIDSDKCELIYDSSPDDRYFYGAGIRVNPSDDNIYAALYAGFISNNYFLYYRLDGDGHLVREYEPISGYWYPAMFLFPDKNPPVPKEVPDVLLTDGGGSRRIDLASMVEDADNSTASIVAEIVSYPQADVASAGIEHGQLVLSPRGCGETSLVLRFNSAGRTADCSVNISVGGKSVGDTYIYNNVKVFARGGRLCVEGLGSAATLYVYTVSGTMVYSGKVSSGSEVGCLQTGQLYIARVGDRVFKINL